MEKLSLPIQSIQYRNLPSPDTGNPAGAHTTAENSSQINLSPDAERLNERSLGANEGEVVDRGRSDTVVQP